MLDLEALRLALSNPRLFRRSAQRAKKIAAEVQEEAHRLSLSPTGKGIAMKCDVPPAGWYCIRPAGHLGPCAALPRKCKMRLLLRLIVVVLALIGLADVALRLLVIFG